MDAHNIPLKKLFKNGEFIRCSPTSGFMSNGHWAILVPHTTMPTPAVMKALFDKADVRDLPDVDPFKEVTPALESLTVEYTRSQIQIEGDPLFVAENGESVIIGSRYADLFDLHVVYGDGTYGSALVDKKDAPTVVLMPVRPDKCKTQVIDLFQKIVGAGRIGGKEVTYGE